MSYDKISRLGFSVIKFRLKDEICFLMRKNSKWKDFNFVGGHENNRDGGNLEQAARRELWEEVPSSRNVNLFLEKITEEIKFGPIYSRSAGALVMYELQFFLVKFQESPKQMLKQITSKSHNRIISQLDVLSGNLPMTNFVAVLNAEIQGGIESLPLSFDEELSISKNANGIVSDNQIDFILN